MQWKSLQMKIDFLFTVNVQIDEAQMFEGLLVISDQKMMVFNIEKRY